MLKTNSHIQNTIMLGASLIAIIFIPGLFYHPFITPKFFLLIIFALYLMFILFFNKKKLFLKIHKNYLLLIFGFIFWILISMLVSEVNLNDGFLGLNNRNEGLITYLCLATFMIAALATSNEDFSVDILILISILGFIAGVYGLIQHFNLDAFTYINEYNQVISFFGNPNFQSSFMGISAIAAFSLALGGKYSKTQRFWFFVLVLFFIFIIFTTSSFQGYPVFLLGLLSVFYLWIRSSKALQKYSLVYLLTCIILGIIFIADTLRLGPWKSFFYQASVSYRGDFWRSGLQMSLDNPIFGVGITGYRDNYRVYRDFVASTRSTSSIVESAHNKIIDMSSMGGFVLLLLYVSLLFLVFRAAIKVIRRFDTFNVGFVGILGCWSGYFIQTLISIFSFGMEIWGWIFAGLIIGYELNTRDKLVTHNAKKLSAMLLSCSLTFIVSLTFIFTYAKSEFNFKSSIEAGEVNRIMLEVQKWPQRNDRFWITTELFNKGGFPNQAEVIARKATEIWPNNFEAWQQLLNSPNLSAAERLVIIEKMKELDPLNPTLR